MNNLYVKVYFILYLIKKEYRNKISSFLFPYGARDHPIPAGMFVKPDTPNKNIHAVNTKGPVRAGKPHIPKNLCRAGITITLHATVANTASKNDWGVSGTKLVRAIMTST